MDDCSGIVVGNSYFVEVNYGNPLPTSTTTGSTGTATPVPSPTQTGIIGYCVNYYKAASGDTCDGIIAKYGTFTTAEFISWNPAVGSACSSLWPEYFYCVGIPSTPTKPTVTLTTTATTSTGPSPTQTGIIRSCVNYYKAASGNTCDKIVAKYGTFTSADFISWNPAVGSTCSGIWPEYYYCVGIPSTATTKATATATATSGPSPTSTGIIKTCTTYQKAVDGDLRRHCEPAWHLHVGPVPILEPSRGIGLLWSISRKILLHWYVNISFFLICICFVGGTKPV